MGKRIKEAIQTKGITQKKFCDDNLLNTRTLCLHTEGKTACSIEMLAKYAKALGVSADYLLFGDGEKESESAKKSHVEPTAKDVWNALNVLVDVFGENAIQVNKDESGATCSSEIRFEESHVCKYLDILQKAAPMKYEMERAGIYYSTVAKSAGVSNLELFTANFPEDAILFYDPRYEMVIDRISQDSEIFGPDGYHVVSRAHKLCNYESDDPEDYESCSERIIAGTPFDPDELPF